MAYIKTSDSIIIKATLTDKGRKLLSRGKFKIAKFALGDDELDYNLVDPDLFDTDIPLNPHDPETSAYRKYIPAIKVQNIFEAYSADNKSILFGLNSYDEGLMYLTRDDLDTLAGDNHACILYIPILKTNEKLEISPTLTDSVYYYSVNDETTEKLETISNFKFLTTDKLENTKIVIESGIDIPFKEVTSEYRPTMKNRREQIIKKFLLDHDYFVYADNRFFRKIVGINQGSRFENFPSGEIIVNLKTGVESPPISLESQFDSHATFLTKGIPNLIAAQKDMVHAESGKTTESGVSGFTHSAMAGARGSVVAFNPLIDQKLKTTSTGERDFRYSEYGYTEQIVFSELPNSKFDYIDTTIYVIGGTTNSRVQIPVRLIRYAGT
jgi:hypothetical protein